MGQVIGSVGEDGYFKLWEEDVSQLQNSGHRFRQIMTPLASKTQLPWMSIDFKNINTETYLALITRDGELSIMEPKDHDLLSGDWTDWMQGTGFRVCPEPARSEEASFRVCFHHEKMPCWEAVAAGLDYRSISLAVVAMNEVKIYRTDRDHKLYMAASMDEAHDLVRDVAWANGSMRGYDILATASKDGAVRVYELRTSSAPFPVSPTQRLKTNIQPPPPASATNTTRSGRNTPSGIGAGLLANARMSVVQEEDEDAPGRVKQLPTMVAELTEHQGAVWKVAFSFNGLCLSPACRA